MASKYWIKLYQEILYDRKMVQLDDHLYRRLIECFLMAGEQNEGGYLPSLDDIAFVLRSTNEMIETDLNELIQRGFLEFKEQRYFVRKFAERQSAMSSTERWQRWRDSQRKEQYEGVTEVKRNSNDSLVDKDKDIDKDIDIDLDKEKNGYGHISTLFEREIAALTPQTFNIINEWIDSYSINWIEDAIKVAVENNARKPSYVTAVLENWKRDGRQSKGGNKSQKVDSVTAQLEARRQRANERK